MNIVCFGDSITYGYPLGPAMSWVSHVAAETGIKMINAGENGDTTEDLRRRLDKDVLALNPTHVFVLVGPNDASVGYSLKRYTESLSTLLEEISGAGVNPLLGLPIPSLDCQLNKVLQGYRESLLTVAKVKGLRYLDFNNAMISEKGTPVKTLYLDEVHPNKAGYREMGRLAVPFFRELKIKNNQ